MDTVDIDNRADSFLCFLYSGATSVEEEIAVVKMIHVLLVQFSSMSSRKVLDRVLLRADVDKLTTMIMVTMLTVSRDRARRVWSWLSRRVSASLGLAVLGMVWLSWLSRRVAVRFGGFRQGAAMQAWSDRVAHKLRSGLIATAVRIELLPSCTR